MKPHALLSSGRWRQPGRIKELLSPLSPLPQLQLCTAPGQGHTGSGVPPLGLHRGLRAPVPERAADSRASGTAENEPLSSSEGFVY